MLTLTLLSYFFSDFDILALWIDGLTGPLGALSGAIGPPLAATTGPLGALSGAIDPLAALALLLTLCFTDLAGGIAMSGIDTGLISFASSGEGGGTVYTPAGRAPIFGVAVFS